MKNESLGIRQNNPGNIVYDPHTNWIGQCMPHPGGRFVWFDGAIYGLRALIMTLRTYELRHGCNTLSKFINRWAPPVENNTSTYLSDVLFYLRGGATADGFYSVMTPAPGIALAQAIVHHENGAQPYDETLWTRAYGLTLPSEGPTVIGGRQP